MKQFLSGKKTYLISVLMILIGLIKLIVGDISMIDFITSEDVMFILGGAGLGTMRAAVEKNGPVVKVILIFLLPSLFMGCSSNAFTFKVDNPEVTLTDQPQQLAEIIDLAYSGYAEYELSKKEAVEPLALTMKLFGKLKTAVENSPLVLEEIRSLTDAQILGLANLGDKYELGIYKPKFIQVVKVCLFLTQTYYVFKPAQEISANEIKSYLMDPEFLVDLKIKTIRVLN